MSKPIESGYRPCACRDCFEIAIGEPGALCHACEDAGCAGDRECQAAGAYGGESDDTQAMPLTSELIRARCEHAGFCLVSEGTNVPVLVVERLLTALMALAPAVFDGLLATTALLDLAPEIAADAAHPFWETSEAAAILTEIIAALNRAAPAGFFFGAEGEDRLGFYRC